MKRALIVALAPAIMCAAFAQPAAALPDLATQWAWGACLGENIEPGAPGWTTCIAKYRAIYIATNPPPPNTCGSNDTCVGK